MGNSEVRMRQGKSDCVDPCCGARTQTAQLICCDKTLSSACLRSAPQGGDANRVQFLT